MKLKDIMKKQVVNNSITRKLPAGTYEDTIIKAWTIAEDSNKEERILVTYVFNNGVEFTDRWSTRVDQFGVTIIERITNALNRATNGIAEGLPIDEFLDKFVEDAIKFSVDIKHNGDYIQVRVHTGTNPTSLEAAEVEDPDQNPEKENDFDLDKLEQEAEEAETKEQTK